MAPIASMRFACTFDDDTDQDVVYGIGDNEMCILFGYLYPVRGQFLGHSTYQGMPCQSFDVGLLRRGAGSRRRASWLRS